MFISLALNHYKRSDVRSAIASQSQDKEVSVMYGPSRFGKRPDTISYPDDVLELAKRKASSFHCSEELWENPLAIKTGMRRSELDELRLGWDLILDIDCPDWEFSKLIAHLFVRAIQDHDVTCVTAKFSGNKGFHIAVPFEAFPEHISYEGELHPTKNLFPEGPRKIASYLLGYITEHFAVVRDNEVVFDNIRTFSFDELSSIASKTSRSLFAYQCVDCHSVLESLPRTKTVYECGSCGHISKPSNSPEFILCEQCSQPVSPSTTRDPCPECGSYSSPKRILNLLSVVEVDTILIASRHLYRMPYSLHEKSELVSVPVNPSAILSFEKSMARPENISFSIPFLERSTVVRGQAHRLVSEAFGKELAELGHIHADIARSSYKKPTSYETPTDAIEKEHFPPCINNILSGLEDGRKRGLFILINFLRSVGWSLEQIDDLIHEWNENNAEPLREQYLKSQLTPAKKGKQVMPPPNCSNKDYYVGIGVCSPIQLCNRIANPSSFARKKKSLSSKKSSRKSSRKKSQSSASKKSQSSKPKKE